MEQLFEFDKNMNIVPAPEVLVFSCFDKLWKRDKSKGKSNALKELGYIWYMCTQNLTKNPYYLRFANNQEEKSKSIIEDIFDKEYTPDAQVKECMEFFIKRNYKEACDTRDALIVAKTNLKEWFKTFNSETDSDGLQLQRNTKSIQELDKAIKEYNALVDAEEKDNSRVTGGGEIGAFEDV